MNTDVLIVGAGPAGSAAATWAARAGFDVLLVDAVEFPRDKTCGDGLTPRAIAELHALGMDTWLAGRPRNNGVRMLGFGGAHELAWNGPQLPNWGSAAPRMELDDAIRQTAIAAGAQFCGGMRARGVELGSVGNVTSVVFDADGHEERIQCRRLIVADGVRSQLGRVLGRQWHRDTVFGVAARAYVASARHDDPWITSHLELRDEAQQLLSGYGWIFPLGDGHVNIGVGTLATQRRPADVKLREVLNLYVAQQRDEWQINEHIRMYASAMLPMGGAVSNVSGTNWMLIGDAAACVNPLNGEGIDYGLETGRLAVQILGEPDYSDAWRVTLQSHYGDAFSIARRLGSLLTLPRFLPIFGPVGMQSSNIMAVALRIMGNLITAEDRDLTARMWRAAGQLSQVIDARKPWS
jgi:geranylgeranyl reductase family protein